MDHGAPPGNIFMHAPRVVGLYLKIQHHPSLFFLKESNPNSTLPSYIVMTHCIHISHKEGTLHMKSRICFAAIILAAAPLLAAGPAHPPTDFTISTPSNIPGATLQPGPYTIRVVNRLSDRVILRIDSPSANLHSIFIGIPNKQIEKPSTTGPVRWSSAASGAVYLKGWYFPGTSSVVEFVYPKADALAIASSNPSKVPAIDPASEGKVTDNTLSQSDMQLLTLWLLSVEQVQGTAQSPAVKAERYQPTAVAKLQKPVIATLPHTGSLLPLVWLIGLFSILAATALHLIRSAHRPTAQYLETHSKPNHVNTHRHL
jgi:hypothetical protein